MTFLKRLFQSSESADPEPPIPFGRFSDSYKSSYQYDCWEKALDLFEKEAYLPSFHAFFEYLRDEEKANVVWKEENGTINFELFQGSKKVIGYANVLRLRAEAKVVKANQMNIGFMRRLMEQNFDLKYGRFSLDKENNICIIFDTHTLDGSPYKLYYALKEIATRADKQDDLLIDEFPMLSQVASHHTEELPKQEKEIRFVYTNEQIQSVFNAIDTSKLKVEQYPGAIAYQLLHLCYKLDYLVVPEGFMMELLERIHRKYFENDGTSTGQKIVVMRKEFRRLLDRPREAVFKEMYRVNSTFGITTPVNHDKVVSFIDGELHNMDWYRDNDHMDVALSIPGYIVGYCLFNYAVPKPIQALFHFYYEITESNYFQALGLDIPYFSEKGQKLHKKAIKKRIGRILDFHKSDFPSISANLDLLEFGNLVDFSKSFLIMVREMNL